MQHDSSLFWADIKNYEERLARNPDSLFFARLAEVYLKVGLVDDALHTARTGVTKFPAYVSGQRVLAQACHAKGLMEEGRQALEKVVAALPEDAEAQKMLGRLMTEAGEIAAARRAFGTALEFNPDDAECRLELDALEVSTKSRMAVVSDAVAAGSAVAADSDDEEIIEDIEIIDIDEADLLEEFEDEDVAPPVCGALSEHEDPLSTATLAELYVQQGHVDKALDIYRAVSADGHPGKNFQSRIVELEVILAASAAAGLASAASLQTVQKTASALSVPPALVSADSAVATLEGWLENIRRIRACR